MRSVSGHRLGVPPRQRALQADRVQRAIKFDQVRGAARFGATPQHRTLARHLSKVIDSSPTYSAKIKSGVPVDEDDLELIRTGLKKYGYRMTNLGGGSYSHVFGAETPGNNPEALALKMFLTESDPDNIQMFGRPVTSAQMIDQASKGGLIRRLSGLLALPVSAVGPGAAIAPRIGGDIGPYKGRLITPQRLDIDAMPLAQGDDLASQVVRHAVMDQLTGKIDTSVVNNTAVLEQRLPSGGSRTSLVSLDNDLSLLTDIDTANHYPWMPDLLESSTRILGPQRTTQTVLDTVDRALVSTDLHQDLTPYGLYLQGRASRIPDMQSLWTPLTADSYASPAGATFADYLADRLRDKTPAY